nr:heparan-alpha-glucosaminide N-acetyltransferase domain-containing protein [Brevibacterium daeguense]
MIGIDAARGLALVGLIAVHILPAEIDETGDPTVAFHLFYGNSAALFALLAGVGLALSSGGRSPHQGRRMVGDRLGLAVRAALIGTIALIAAAIMPNGGSEPGILLYYSVFFLLAIPFLHLGPQSLFLSAALFGLAGPLLLQYVGPLLPESSADNHTLVNLVGEPAGTASELLLTGIYPALPYMCFILAGLGIGRLDLRNTSVVARIAGIGAALAVAATGISSILLYGLGGYERLLETPGMTEDLLYEAIAFGPDTVPNDSAWWFALVTPHTNMPLAIADSLGLALLVTALFILAGRRFVRWLTPLAVTGTMTLTLYTTHLLVLSTEIHEGLPAVWFVVHLAVAVAFAMCWSHWRGQGPLERPVTAIVRRSRQLVDPPSPGDSTGPMAKRDAMSR